MGPFIVVIDDNNASKATELSGDSLNVQHFCSWEPHVETFETRKQAVSFVQEMMCSEVLNYDRRNQGSAMVVRMLTAMIRSAPEVQLQYIGKWLPTGHFQFAIVDTTPDDADLGF